MPARKSNKPDNAAEISRLRRKKMLTLSVFFGSIAFMPLSCATCCGAAAFIPNDTAKGIFGIAGFLAPFIGLVGLILMWSDRSRYGRSVELAEQADELGMSFTEQPPKDQLELLRSFQVFRDPTSERGRNALVGTHEGRSVLIADYSCAWGVGGGAYVTNQTCVVFEAARGGVPDLIVTPKGVLDKLADAVGLEGNAIKIPHDAKFNKKFALFAAKAIKATACLTPKLTALCLEEGNIVLEVNAGNLLIYWSETDLHAADLEDSLATADEVLQQLEGDA